MWEWDTNIIAAFVSAGVSVLFSFIYWCLDDYRKKKQEKELFIATKQLIIEFVEFIDSNMNDTGFSQEYRICVGIKMLARISMCDTGENNVALLYAGIYTLKTKYKLTDRQIEMILCIIEQSSPKIINKTYIGFEDKNRQEVFFCIESENYQEEIERETLTISNINFIPQLLQELQNGEWDNFIKTAIKELGLLLTLDS